MVILVTCNHKNLLTWVSGIEEIVQNNRLKIFGFIPCIPFIPVKIVSVYRPFVFDK